LNAIWALTWALEAITHLEELCFWLYLIHAGPVPVPWLKSVYFRFWAVGSAGAFITIFAVMVSTASNTFLNEACLQFTGSLIGLLITLGILPVIYTFPGFIQAVRNEGGDMRAVVRLAKFHDLNMIRTIFRFLFVLPILILSIDGMTPHDHPLNDHMSTTDALLVIAGIACMVQSACTLMIFFPRDVEMETRRWLQSIPKHVSKSYRLQMESLKDETALVQEQSKYLLTDSPVQKHGGLPLPNDSAPRYHVEYPQNGDAHRKSHLMDTNNSWPGALTEANMRVFAETASKVNPLALYFNSPLDFDGSPGSWQREERDVD